MRHFLLYWLPVIAWMVLIFIMSTSRFSSANTARFVVPVLRFLFRRLTPNGLTRAHIRVREAAHFSEYLILSVLLFRGLRADSDSTWELQWMAISLAVLVAYAVLDEIHQMWEAGRTASWRHALIDIVGGAAGQLLIITCVYVVS